MKVLLQINQIHKAYGTHVILDDATVSINEGDKIGVIGRNGAGKSTLCKIITGHDEADRGTIVKNKDFRLAYLEQHDPYDLEETVIDFLMRYTKKEEWQCAKIAGKFQLKKTILQEKIGALSGGYRTRIKLTSMLLLDPNFLILDEPTNYLDLKTLILLEEFLKEYRGGFIVVSHDREFLKKTCELTLEIENGSCTLYPGSVDDYLIFKEEQKEQILSFNKNIESKQKQLQKFIDRFRAKASKASQARSKEKELQKLKAIDVGHSLGNVKIVIPQVSAKKGISLKTQDLDIGYPDYLVAKKINLEIDQGAHVAVLGDNGQGKTTFLKTIANQLDALGGSFRWGHHLKVGYYAQHVFHTLDEKDTVFQYLSKIADFSVTDQEILNLAGCFLFRGKDVEKTIEVLSGGERARLCLAGLLLQKNRVLLLDEPTNHLDFETVEALGDALKKFQGTVFFISHDRTFVNLMATEILEVSNQKIIRYLGNYEDYVYTMEKNIQKELVEFEEEIKINEPKKKNNYQLKKEAKLKKKELMVQVKEIEKRLEINKSELNEINSMFVNDATSWSREKNQRYEQLAQWIEKDETRWLQMNEEIELLDGILR